MIAGKEKEEKEGIWEQKDVILSNKTRPRKGELSKNMRNSEKLKEP